AVALEVGKLLGQRRVELARERGIELPQRARRLRELGGDVRALLQLVRKAAGGDDTVADGGEGARAPARNHEPRERAGEIGRRRAGAAAHAGARGGVGHEKSARARARGDGGGICRGGPRARGERARARRRYAAVDGGKELSAALARERAHELEIAAGRLVDRERRSLRLAHGRRQRRAPPPPRAVPAAGAGGGCPALRTAEHTPQPP